MDSGKLVDVHTVLFAAVVERVGEISVLTHQISNRHWKLGQVLLIVFHMKLSFL